MQFNDTKRLNSPFPRPEEKQSALLPKPPMNVFVISPFINGILDVRWDNPALLPENTAFQILGVNVYRSFDSEGGPYTKINSTPLGVGVYRDITTNTFVDGEIVTNLNRGLNPQHEWKFKTKFAPLVQNTVDAKLALRQDVVVKVDNGDGNGLMEVPYLRMHPETGEIVLISTKTLDPATQKLVPARLPLNTPGALTVSYYFNANRIKSQLHNRIFYKLTTIGVNSDGQTVESDLNLVRATNLYQQERTDWIWKEAVRRNRWILEQGGERVKVFIRKWNGKECSLHKEDELARNTIYDCPVCFGTTIEGGYEGPFDMIIAPPDTEKNVELTEIGLRVNYNWETWTGPSPLLNKRDIIVRPTGERLSIGSINYVGQRGAIFQQMFTIQQLDSEDMTARLPIDGAQINPAEPWDTRSGRPSDASPTIPDNKPTDRNYPLEKGRTVTFEDIVY